jgi:uncharacterized membrane protein YfcA
MNYQFSIAGLIVGILIGMMGVGGGSLLAPILIILFRVPPAWAVASDITYSAVTKALGSVIHIRQKQVNFRVAFWLACGSVPATLISVLLVQYVRKHSSTLIDIISVQAIGIVLILAAVLFLLKPHLMRWIDRRQLERLKQEALLQEEKCKQEAFLQKEKRKHVWVRPVATILAGAVVGFLVGFTSVGSGSLIIAAMAFLYPRLTTKEMVGTDIFQAFLLLLAGVFGYLGSGMINWPLVASLLLGSLPGVVIGSILSRYIPNQYLNLALAIVLGLSGLKLI